MRAPLTVLLTSLLLAPTGAALADGDGDLLGLMGQMQQLSHKTALSIDQRNAPLAGFYVHELEETLEQVEQIATYDGHPVGELSGSMLAPSLGALEDALDKSDWETTSGRFDELVSACNACHQATEHGYIRIERRQNDPYMQSFAPAQD